MYNTTDFRKGLKIEFNKGPYIIVENQHVNPGKGSAFIRTKLKNLQTGQVIEHTFKSGEKVPRPDLEEKDLQFLYTDPEAFHFMDTKSYDQIELTPDVIGQDKNYLIENETVVVLFYNGQAVSIEHPNFVSLKVVETQPNIKGDTAAGSGSGKPATFVTGLVVTVPFHINEGDILKIDTRTGKYVERVKTARKA